MLSTICRATHSTTQSGRSGISAKDGTQGRPSRVWYFAVNPKYQTLLGRPCVPSLADMPERPDCVVLCVARQMVESMIEAAAAAGAGGVVVYASGFAETAKPDR